MKSAFKTAFRIYKYVLILYLLVFCTMIIIDDYSLIVMYWKQRWLQYIIGYGIWFLIYGVGLSFYYWGISTVVILIYFKFIKNRKVKKDYNNPEE